MAVVSRRRQSAGGKYEPGEDSFMLLEAAEAWLVANVREGMRILDMGTGSGFIISGVRDWLAKNGVKALLCASDIDERPRTLPPDVRFVRSDLFSSISGTFDLILFNPPYLPEAKEDRYLTEAERKQLLGGRRGNELTLRFLEQLRPRLSPGGACLLLTSSAAHPEEVQRRILERGMSVRNVAGESFPFERLSVFLIRNDAGTLQE